MVEAGKVGLVTGATRGIGLESARQLASLGVHVVLGARDIRAGRARAREMRENGLSADTVELDLCDPTSHARVADNLEDRFGRLDILVNNAGVFFGDTDGLPGSAEIETVRATFETNFFGPLSLTRTVLPLVRKAKAGRIVFVSSTVGSLAANSDDTLAPPDHKWIGYSASKAAINMLVVQLAAELRDTPIKVNAVCPGVVKTDMNDGFGDVEVEDGAIASVRYALLDEDGPNGGFFNAAGRLPW